MSNVNLVTGDSDYLKVTSDRTTKQELDKDAFMNLLVTQMKYQDPLNPMDNQQMMAQLAQFSALEQMTNVAQTVEKQFANGMIGKHVSYQYTDSDTGQTQYLIGKVDYVKINSGETLIGIGDKEIKVKDVKQVLDPAVIQANTSAFELIEKTIQGLTKEKNSQGAEEEVIVEGEVLGVKMKDEQPYLIIGTGEGLIEIDFNNVQNIVDKPTITGRIVTATIKDESGEEQTIQGLAEYIKIKKEGTYVYVDGQFIAFEDIHTIANK
ncbi:flagellar hook assembly protein FlgD [Cellulosilyticum sp. I15G10I2]|uniref:flagellar hook assembly protein FlgD n=1 Tax=Cellulosilyticum sp. I15G10I2 TaxID=1892843 RepID=UPI00085C0449|nr:flagellar hook capping FlgD N-terminal domain-containing protein [Cellulosilyticum sp. I15G10I2]